MTQPGVDLVVDFVNTNDIEDRRDQIATPALLAGWLAERELAPRGLRTDAATHKRAIDLREGLRSLGRANNGETADANAVRDLDRATSSLPLVARLGIDSSWRLEPHGVAGVDVALAGIVAIVAAAMADGTWPRVKACQNDACRWLYVDRSRNRSRTWCTMAICGARMKARAYRARQREGT